MGFPMSGGGSGQKFDKSSMDPLSMMLGGLFGKQINGMGAGGGMPASGGGRAAAKGPMPDWWMDWYNTQGKFGGVPPAPGALPPQAAAPAQARRSGAGFQPMMQAIQMLRARRGGGLLD
jgi:hypothetical protein